MTSETKDKTETGEMDTDIPRSMISNTNSLMDVPKETALKHQLFGCSIIAEATKKLQYPTPVMLSAQSVFHRFYLSRSFARNDAFSTAMGCFLLGCKIEEVTVSLREVVFVFYELIWERNGLPARSLELTSPSYTQWKDEVVLIELTILKELGFSLYNKIEHHHQYILYILAGTGHSENTELTEAAFHYLNEAKNLNVELRYNAIVIAAAAVMLASNIHDTSMPSAWWAMIEVEYDAMKAVCDEVLDMYDIEQVSWVEPLTRVDYLLPVIQEINQEKSRDDLVDLKIVQSEFQIPSFALPHFSIRNTPPKPFQLVCDKISEFETISDGMSGDTMVEEILFDPADTMRILIHDSNTYGNEHSPLSVVVSAQDMKSAVLILIVSNRTYLQHGAVQDPEATALNQQIRFPLDIFVDIVKENVTQDDHGRVMSITYSYHRFGEVLSFEAIITDASADSFVDLHAFDFILGQFTIKDDKIDREILQIGEEGSEKGNFVATGFETTGTIMRSALKTSGQYTGHLIRYLGQQYTAATVDNKDASDQTHSAAVIDPQVIEAARRRKAWAEGVNSSARTLTSTILYPVRWTGQKAAKLGNTSNSSNQSTNNGKHRLSKSVWEAAEGMGNGVTSVFKGVTEALGEVGSAIGDTALYHAKQKYGDEYAETVTQSYIDAAGEIGLAGYKLTNVVSFGLAGLMIDVVVEGTTLLVSLYEYLIGPILLQGWMMLLQPPMTEKKLYYAVLRPWSLAFYDSPRQFALKPSKIIPIFLLDTLPRLRLRGSVNHAAAETGAEVVQGEVEITGTAGGIESPVAVPRYPRHSSQQQEEQQEEEETLEIIEADSILFPPPTTGTDNHNHPDSHTSPPHSPASQSRRSQINHALQSWSGGIDSHIELTTIDCSTYLLYMHPNPESAILHTWYNDLQTAVKRVETLAKRRTEAVEIAVIKRLLALPKKRVVHIKVLRFIPLMKKKALTMKQSTRKEKQQSGFFDGLLKKNGRRSLLPFRQPGHDIIDDCAAEQEEDEDAVMLAFYQQEDRQRQAVRQMVMDRQHTASAGGHEEDDESYEGYLSEDDDGIFSQDDNATADSNKAEQTPQTGSNCFSSSAAAKICSSTTSKKKASSSFGGPRMITITATPSIHSNTTNTDIVLTQEQVTFSSTPLLRLGAQLDALRLALLNSQDHARLDQNELLQAELTRHVSNYEAVDNDKLLAEFEFSSFLPTDDDQAVQNEGVFGRVYSLFERGSSEQGKIEFTVQNTSSHMKMVSLLGKGTVSFEDIFSASHDITAADDWKDTWIPIMKEGHVSGMKQVGTLHIAYRMEEVSEVTVEATAVVNSQS